MKLEKREQAQSKGSRRKKIIKSGVEISKTENRKTIEKNNQTKSCFLKKINKIDKPLAKLKEKRESTQINNYK